MFSLLSSASCQHDCPHLLVSAVLRRRCCWARPQLARGAGAPSCRRWDRQINGQTEARSLHRLRILWGQCQYRQILYERYERIFQAYSWCESERKCFQLLLLLDAANQSYAILLLLKAVDQSHFLLLLLFSLTEHKYRIYYAFAVNMQPLSRKL